MDKGGKIKHKKLTNIHKAYLFLHSECKFSTAALQKKKKQSQVYLGFSPEKLASPLIKKS